MIRIILFEDNKNYREALEDALSFSDRVFLSKSFDNANSAVKNVKEYQPDLVLMDIEMPGISGLDALSEISKECPETKVMIQTQFEDTHRIFVALCRGAWGYALKNDPFDKLENAIVDLYQGGGYFSPAIAGKVARLFASKQFQETPDYISLTPREKEVLTYLAKAYKYQEIADAMFLSYEGVHSHIKNLYNKLHVSSRSSAVLKAIESKLI